jgi:hypothetical protein
MCIRLAVCWGVTGIVVCLRGIGSVRVGAARGVRLSSGARAVVAPPVAMRVV